MFKMFKRFFRSCFPTECFESIEGCTQRYREKRIIGGGSCSTIVLAIDDWAEEKVVLKKATNHTEKLEIAAEYELLRHLDHPNIIKPVEFVSEGFGFMVLPYYNKDMFERASTKRLSRADMKMFVQKMTSAVNYLHSQDMVHRDIKPENILINRNYSSVVLSDFGFAKKVSKNVTNICGTMSYIAPEVHQAYQKQDFENELDWKKCDVFSLGVTFYTLYEFDFLFYNRKETQATTPDQKYIDKQIDLIKCDDDLKDLLKKMLVVDPEQRISMNDVVEHPYLNDHFDKV